jgi:hypothetical protein
MQDDMVTISSDRYARLLVYEKIESERNERKRNRKIQKEKERIDHYNRLCQLKQDRLKRMAQSQRNVQEAKRKNQESLEASKDAMEEAVNYARIHC